MIILSAIVADTGWHWMLDRADALWKTPCPADHRRSRDARALDRRRPAGGGRYHVDSAPPSAAVRAHSPNTVAGARIGGLASCSRVSLWAAQKKAPALLPGLRLLALGGGKTNRRSHQLQLRYWDTLLRFKFLCG